MPSFAVPLHTEFADPDPSGPLRRFDRARIPAAVQTASGRFAELPFFTLDTGSSYTTISATLARVYGIPFPSATSRIGMTTATGFRSGLVHDGELRVRFPHLPDQTFRLYCVFAEDIPPTVPPVFGLNDFLDVFRVSLDGSPTIAAPFGAIQVTTII